MGSIFGGGVAQDYQAQTQGIMNNALDRAAGAASKWGKKGLKRIDDQKKWLLEQHGKPIDFQTPGHGIHLDSTGGFLKRTGETQGFMDALKGGLLADEAGYTDLLSQITPGFGRLSTAQAQEIENQGRAAVGNLREQLARRRVLGASFANDQMSGLKATYDQMKNKATAEAFVQEMEMTKQVIGQRTEARNQTISQAMQNIQFETEQGTKLTALALANNNDMARLMTELATTGAQIAAGIGQTIAGAASSLGGSMIGAMPGFANIAAQEAAGPGALLGTLGGALLGNTSLFGGAGT